MKTTRSLHDCSVFAESAIASKYKPSNISEHRRAVNDIRHPTTIKHQKGATLIELMVGITIGLMTIAVATGALMISRSVSGTVTDASQIQQQASYAFRVIGQQLRQTRSTHRISWRLRPMTPSTPPQLQPLLYRAKMPLRHLNSSSQSPIKITPSPLSPLRATFPFSGIVLAAALRYQRFRWSKMLFKVNSFFKQMNCDVRVLVWHHSLLLEMLLIFK